jgi:superfamily II DNA or RNA helicase
MIIEDRDYQIDGVNYAMGHGLDDRIIHCAPTGSGKTVMQAKICKREMDRGDRTAIMTPRNEIFTQTHGITSEICGAENISILRAKRVGESWNSSNPIHIVSWPTLISRARRSKFWFPDVHRVQVDECHLSMAPKILEILEHYAPKAIIDGWTATPSRQTGKGLGRFFTSIKHVTTVRQLIKDGHLCPVEYWGGNTPDMAGIKIVRGDYEIGKLSRASQKLVGDVVDNWLRLAADRHTIVFSVDVAHCEMLAHRFKTVGIRAEALHSHMDDEDRDEVVRMFKAGEIQVLVNVQIASYGFDAPSVNCIVVARKTRSIVLHLQMIGRGMRPAVDEDGEVIRDPDHPGFKTCMVLDHAGNVPALGQADDLFRWRLDDGKKATARVNEKGEPEEPVIHVCEGVLDDGAVCGHIFSQARVCPKCGWKVPFSKKDVEVVDADLVRIGKKLLEKLPKGFPTHEIFFAMLAHYAAHKQPKAYKPGWALAQFKEKCGEWPPRHWGGIAMVPPSKRVLNWIRSRNIAFHQKRKADIAAGVPR